MSESLSPRTHYADFQKYRCGTEAGTDIGLVAYGRWYGDESGPMVRLYALTKGRARPVGEYLDVIALVLAGTRPEYDLTLSPEQAAILELCQGRALPVAEIAARAALPLNIVRVLLADLLDAGHIRVTQPNPPGRPPNDQILREVLDGLRAL